MRFALVLFAVLAGACASANPSSPDAAPADGDAPDAPPADAPIVIDHVDVVGIGTLPAGTSSQYQALATYTDNHSEDITSTATWTSNDASVATVDHMGLVTGTGVGTTRIFAKTGAVGGSADIVVANGTLTSVTISAPPSSVPKGRTAQLMATGSYTDGTMQDVTAAATWTSGTPAVATVTGGLVTGVGLGNATLHAVIGSVDQTVSVTISAAVPDHLAISVGDFTLAEHQRAQLHASTVYSDNTTVDATATATWTSSAASATVTAGRVDAQGTSGPSTITATSGAMSAHVVATVTTAQCHLVINEVQAAGSSSSDEWVELYNPCTSSIAATGYTLVYRSSSNVGTTDTNTLASLTQTIAAGGFLLFAGQGYAGTGAAAADGTWGGGTSGLLAGANGAVGLRNGPASTGTLVDAIAYGNVTAGSPFIEGTTATALATGKSDARAPFDGNDTNTGAADFALTTAPTPKALNAP